MSGTSNRKRSPSQTVPEQQETEAEVKRSKLQDDSSDSDSSGDSNDSDSDEDEWDTPVERHLGSEESKFDERIQELIKVITTLPEHDDLYHYNPEELWNENPQERDQWKKFMQIFFDFCLGT